MPEDVKDLILALTRKVERLDARLANHFSKPEIETWVKAKIIMKMTGWNKYQMLAARENNVIRWKKGTKGFWYLMESVPISLQKHQPAAE